MTKKTSISTAPEISYRQVVDMFDHYSPAEFAYLVLRSLQSVDDPAPVLQALRNFDNFALPADRWYSCCLLLEHGGTLPSVIVHPDKRA